MILSENVQKAQAKAKELDHCLCDLTIKCECDFFKDFGKCVCAGEGSYGTKEEWFKYNHPSFRK